MSQPWTARWLRSIAAGGGGSGDTSTDGGPTTTTTLAGGGIRRPPRPRPIQASSPSHPRRTGGATRTPRSASSPPSTPRAAEPQEGMIARQQWRLEPVRDTPFVSPARVSAGTGGRRCCIRRPRTNAAPSNSGANADTILHPNLHDGRSNSPPQIWSCCWVGTFL